MNVFNRRAILKCCGTVCGFFAFLSLLNLPHLGINAALHWDASTSILTRDPMPTRAELLENRQHIFDLAAESRSDDPAVVTALFLQPVSLPQHAPLEKVRRYYSQISYALARGAFDLGAALTHSPTGAVTTFQLAAALAMAIGLAALFTLATSRTPTTPGSADTAGRWSTAIALLIFLTIASCPVMLSLSRQMLTETAGFMFFALALAGFSRAVRSSGWWSAISWISLAIVLVFLAVRSRYTLLMACAVVMPVALLMSAVQSAGQRHWRRWLALTAVGGTVLIVLSAIDVHQYGPFIFPNVYQQTLVESTRLYFHCTAASALEAFWVGLYVNGPLLLVPALVTAAAVLRADRARRGAVLLAAAVLAVMMLPMVSMARQRVSYQPRHLFTFVVVFAGVMTMVLPTIRWNGIAMAVIAAVCTLVLSANVYSTFGPACTTMQVPWPATIADIARQRRRPGSHPPLWKDLLDGYFDWSDNSRLHDDLIVLQQLQKEQDRGHGVVLIVEPGTPGGGGVGFLSSRFSKPWELLWPSQSLSVADEQALQQSLLQGKSVLAISSTENADLLARQWMLQPMSIHLQQMHLVRVVGRK